MSIQFSPVIAAQARGGGTFSVRSIGLEELGERAPPSPSSTISA